MRKSNGDLHFYVNGLDQGIAATRVPSQLWGAVDLYGMTVKVTSFILLPDTCISNPFWNTVTMSKDTCCVNVLM